MNRRQIVWRARGLGWGRRLAVFAALLVIEADLAHRIDLIDTPTLLVALGAALLATLAALLATLVAWRDIWRDGASGFGHSLLTGVLALVVLAPFVAAGVGLRLAPPGAIATTDPGDPPPLAGRPVAADGRAVIAPDAAISGRRYPMSSVELFAAARAAALELGWTILSEDEPGAEGDAGGFAAETRTLLLAVPADVTVRIRPAPGGARADLTTAFRIGTVDGGLGQRRIDDFFAALGEGLRRPAEQ
ncbi:DUF1499 domain-containing protein [Methylobrevis sp. L22]|uniref:DUF1499 domain-containing protein n=1 Tax=Methylobrevis albus TaxID=2793297 RepID=A0A931I0J6_9HYPH|nr:DUF1499 domain-containing protein [Methylobrevis albus]